MMTIGGLAHILMVIITTIIIICLAIIVYYATPKWQKIIIYSSISLCVCGILFLHLFRYGTTLDCKNMFEQLFQVCNFNVILLPLCCIRKNELARQYLLYFSMFSALSTFISYPSDVESSMWYSIVTINFWLNHMLIVAIPIMMVCAKWLKPQKKYIPWVLLCLVVYFGLAFFANFAFNGWQIQGEHNHSYTMHDSGIMILLPLFKLIPIPYIYLLPLLIPLALLFYLFAYLFKNYKIKERE